MNRTLARTVPLFYLSVWLGLWTGGCNRGGEAAPKAKDPVVSVRGAPVVVRPVPRVLSLTGSLLGNQSADVAANTQGAVLQTLVERGSLVGKGAVLLRIDARTQGFSSEEAEAQAQSAKAQLEQADKDCARIDRLYGAGAISRVEYDRQHTQCTAAKWTATAAEARLRNARKAVGDTTVRAPFAGMISDRLVSQGEYVRPESRVVRLVAIDLLRLELTVPEAEVALLKPGLKVHFQVSAFPGEVFDGELRYVGPALRAASRDLLVEAVVDNKAGRLRPGMFATARVSLGERSAATIPKAALRTEGDTQRVFVMDMKKRVLEERIVQIAEDPTDSASERDFVEVREGVHQGEIVASPVPKEAQDGARLEEGNGPQAALGKE